MPSLLQSMFFIEGASTVLSGLFILLNPEIAYDFLAAPTNKLSQMARPESAITLMQFNGPLFVALGSALLYAIPDGKNAAGHRTVAALTPLISEVLFIPWLFYKALAQDGGGFDKSRLIQFGLSVVPFVAFRGYALFGNPSLLHEKSKKA